MNKSLILVGVTAVITVVIVIIVLLATGLINTGTIGQGFISGPTPIPQATITLKITDSETGRNVDDVTVLIDEKSVGTTVQSGEIDIPNVEYGRHRVSVLVPYYEQCKVEQYIDVSGDMNVPLSINMPNPVFQVSAEISTSLELFNEYGNLKITVANTGQLVSKDTVAIVFVYSEDNLNTPIGTHIVNFGSVAAGALPITQEISRMNEFQWLKAEEIGIVIVDRWDYTPQNNQVVLQNDVPAALSAQILTQVSAYLQQHPEVIGTIARIILLHN